MLRILAEERLPLRTMHSLRYSFASHLADCGPSTRGTEELLGQSDLANTQGYVHPVSRHPDVVELLDAQPGEGGKPGRRRARAG
jgi:site-specific recombinase XerD